jgi:hypothetical protein
MQTVLKKNLRFFYGIRDSSILFIPTLKIDFVKNSGYESHILLPGLWNWEHGYNHWRSPGLIKTWEGSTYFSSNLVVEEFLKMCF